MKSVSKLGKKGAVIVSVLLLLFLCMFCSMIAGLSETPTTGETKVETVEVTRIVQEPVEKPVEKIVEIETPECKIAKNNEDIYRQIVELRGEALILTSDVIGNYDYYIANVSELNAITTKIEALNGKQIALIAQLQ